MNKNFIILLTFCIPTVFFISCAGIRPSQDMHISRYICDIGTKSPDQLTDFFMWKNPGADKKQVLRLARYYVTEAAMEGVNSDVAFVQMCLETGFLKFGGLVTPDMYNYCGLGAIDSSQPGERFPTEQIGVRAHIQHLHAYGSTGPLNQELVDRRYKYVNPRGKISNLGEEELLHHAGDVGIDVDASRRGKIRGDLHGFSFEDGLHICHGVVGLHFLEEDVAHLIVGAEVGNFPHHLVGFHVTLPPGRRRCRPPDPQIPGSRQ